jgi:hypothetical protein
MPSPSIYEDSEPIKDPGIRADYYGEITRQSEIVLRRHGMATLAFGGGANVMDGFSVFHLFGPTTGGEVGGDE